MASGRKSEDYNWDFAEEVDDGSPKPIQDVEEVYKQVMKDAKAALAREIYETALHILDVALSLKPNDVEALYGKALCYNKLKDMQKEYREILNTILMVNPNHNDARLRLATLEKETDQEHALRLLPEPSADEQPETKLFRATILTSLRRYKEALDVLTSMTSSFFENHFESQLCWARAFRGNHELECAYTHATKAVQLQPNSEVALMTRASIILDYYSIHKKEWPTKPSALARLVASIPASSRLVDSQSRLTTSQSQLTASQRENKAAQSRALLESSRAAPSNKMPPLDTLLSTALKDLTAVIFIKPSSIQALSRRAEVFYLTASYELSVEDHRKVLASPLLQPIERPGVVLKLGQVLFEAGELSHLRQAHEEFLKQLYIHVDLAILTADVAALLVVGSADELLRCDMLIQSTLSSLSSHSLHAMPERNRGPLLLLLAKIYKRIYELKQLGAWNLPPPTSTTLLVSHSSASSSSDPAMQQQLDVGASDLDKCHDYAQQGALLVDEVKMLLREAAFWKQSGESDLVLLFCNQALLLDPNNISARICKAGELFARGEETKVLETLMNIFANDPQVALYRILASHAELGDRLKNLDTFVADLVSPQSPFGTLSMDAKWRIWTTAQFHRGVVQWRLGDRFGAQESFTEVLKTFHDHPGALLHMAELLLTEGEVGLAIEYFNRRLATAYERRLRVHLLLRIAQCYSLLGDYASCQGPLNSLLQLDPTNQAALSLLQESTRLNSTMGSVWSYTRETVNNMYSYLGKWMPRTGAPATAKSSSSTLR